jgi:iduronate 2-sulfatase
MHRLRRLAVLALAALAYASTGVHSHGQARATRNVLLIVVDDLNTDLGAYGHPVVQSPNIDRLARRGVRFDRAHCQYPLCNPSRVSFLSGRRPEATGVYVLNTPARTALPDAVLLPQFFRNQGYFTAGAGKVFHNRATNDAASWDAYQDDATQDPEERAALQARYGGGDGRPSGRPLSSDGSNTRDGTNTRSILAHLRSPRTQDSPWFLALGLHKPHLPWTAPARFFALYPDEKLQRPPEPALRGVPAIALQTELSGFAAPDSRIEALRGYYACVSFIDSLLGEVIDELDRQDLWSSTVVALVSDHGFHLGDHGGLWAKLSAFGASTRVPFILAGSNLPAGQVVTQPVELLDLYPTLAEACGFAVPAGLDGRSLIATFSSSPTSPSHPAASLVYHYDVAARSDVMARTIIGQSWRYTEWDEGRAGREFYWHADDPDEYHNRAGDRTYAEPQAQAAAFLRSLPAPKPGPANRPRALLPQR